MAMNKILNSLTKLESLYWDNESTFLDCPNAINWCPLPFLGISRQDFNLGSESVIQFYKGDLHRFKTLEEFWVHVVLVQFTHEGCNWNDIFSSVSTYRDAFNKASTEEFLKAYKGYSFDICDDALIDLNGVTDCIFVLDEWNDVLAVCKTKDFYFSFHFWSTG